MGPILQANFTDETEGVHEFDLIGESGLWNIFRQYGFINVIGFDNCDVRFPLLLGRRPKIDHLSRNFYCAAFNFLDLRTKKEAND
jgi:hypothetical protein